MSNEKDKAREQEKESELKQLNEWQSEEETSTELDLNVLAMAEQHLEQKQQQATGGGSWWHRLRVPVSVAAGLVVSLGVARLMVTLSGEDMNNMAQTASSQQVEEYYAIEMEADGARQQAALKKEAKAHSLQAERQMMAPPVAPQEPELVVTHSGEQETVVITGSRMRHEDIESAEPTASDSEDKDQVAGFEDTGVLDEAVLGYPLPEVWLEQIEQALEEGDEITALDEWGQFQRTYPEFEVDEKLLNRIKTLQKLGENP